MRKTLLTLIFITASWQVNAQLKISTTATTLCQGTDVSFQTTGIPTNANVQFQRDGVNFGLPNVTNFTIKAAGAGAYTAKALGKDAKWNRKSPDVDYGYLTNVTFINAKIGYAIEGNAIAKTEDGGLTWKDQQASINGKPLYALYFLNELSGFAVGEGSTVIKTDDGGRTWKLVSIPNTLSYDAFFSIRFLDSKIGITTSVYGKTIKTLDGGNTWTTTTSNSNNIFFKSFFVDKNIGYASDFSGTLQKTTDGGVTWTTIYDIYVNDPLPFYVPRIFYSIYFSDANNGWAVGSGGAFINTTNGGKTWTKKNSDTSIDFNTIFFADKNNGYAISFDSKYFQTTDGGSNWVLKTNPVKGASSNSITFIDNKIGWIVGSQGLVISTVDGGNTWQKIRGNTENYQDITFLDSQIGFRVGGVGSIEKTTDGGITWKPQNSTVTDYLKQIQFIDANVGWVLPNSSQYILSTTDGGNTWKKQNARVNDWVINRLKFADAKNGIYGAYRGTVAKTADGGNTWTQVKTTLDTNSSINDIFFNDSKNIWIVGGLGIIAKSTDGGSTWSQLKIDTKYQYDTFLSVFFLDAKTGWVLSRSNRILKTTDGGNTWVELYFQSSGGNSMKFIDSKNGWISDYNLIYRTNDGGTTWNSEPVSTSNGFNNLFVLDAQNAWGVGYGNTYFKYETPLLATSNTITINPKPAAPTLSWSNAEAKLTAVSASAGTLAWLNGANVINNVTATTYQPTASGSYSVRVTDANGCAEVSTSLQITILSSEDPLNPSGIRLFPNPSDGLYNVELTRFGNEKEATLNVIGLDGQNLHSQTMKRQNDSLKTEVDVRKLPAGIYFLQVLVGQETTGIKISIAK